MSQELILQRLAFADLTRERDRLLKENERLRKALDEISSYSQSWEYSVRAEHCGRIARAALKSEKQ